MTKYSFSQDLKKQFHACTKQTNHFVKKFPSRWNTFWFRECPPHAIALFRLIFGFHLLIVWAARCRDFRALFTNEGFALPMIDRGVPDVLLLFTNAPSFPIALLLMTIFFAAMILLTIGQWAKLSSGVLLILSLYYWQLSTHLITSTMDMLIFFILLVLLFTESDATLSLHMKRRYGSFLAWKSISILPQRLLSIQLTALYVGVGWQKLLLPDWQDGRMLFHSFRSIWATKLSLRFARLGFSMRAYDFFVAFVKWAELILPTGLWIPKIQWMFFVLGTLFHLSVALFFGLWWFLLLPPMYVLFLPPEQVADLFRGKRIP